MDACLDHLPDAGFNVLNWGKQTDITEVKQRVGDRMCLMGNVNPLEIGVRGTPEEVKDATLEVLEGSGGEGIILSVGGGTSPGMPRENILAMLERSRSSMPAESQFTRARKGTHGRLRADESVPVRGQGHRGRTNDQGSPGGGPLRTGGAERRLDRRDERGGRGFQAQRSVCSRGADRGAGDEGRHGGAQAAAERQGRRPSSRLACC